MFTVMGVAERVSAGMTSGGKQKYATNVIDLENWKNSSGTQGGSGSSGSGSQNQGGSGSGSAQSYALTITKAGSGTSTVKDDSEQAIASGASVASGSNVNISVVPAEGQTPTATLNGSSVSLTENDGTYTGSFQMPAQASTLVINSGTVSGGGGDDGLDTN